MRVVTFWLSLILIFVIPWENMISVTGVGELGKVAGLLVGVSWVATVVITGRLRRLHLFHVMVYLFVLWNSLSILWSVDVEETVTRILTDFQLFILILILWDLYITPAALKAALQAYVLGAYVSMSSIVINLLSGTTALWQRYSATGFGVDDIGVILALGLPVAWYLGTSECHTKTARVLKLVNLAYIPASLLSIALTGTRAALVACLPGLLFGLGSLTRLKLTGRVLGLALVLLALVTLQSYVPQTSLERLSTTGGEIAGGDLNGRVTIWRAGLAAFLERPFLGYGGGAFRAAARTSTVGLSKDKVAHNSFISVLVELGLIGFILFGNILATAFRQAMCHPKWDAIFWLTVLLVWALGAFTLTWEARKQTWLFLSLAVASASQLPLGDESNLFTSTLMPIQAGMPFRRGDYEA